MARVVVSFLAGLGQKHPPARSRVHCVGRLSKLVYRVQRVAWKVFRPRTRGVKLMLFNEQGQILLIRNTYGDPRLLVLPGGGVRPFESFAHAARREAMEELSCEIQAPAHVGTFTSTAEGKVDTVQLFTAQVLAHDIQIDHKEVAEALFCDIHELPVDVSPATRRRIDEHTGARRISDTW